ncbi:hypothetical protein EBZ39_00355 [bacterium]|nr:hypothetical protein [bacterium]
MDPIQKLIKSLPPITTQPNIPGGVQQALASALDGFSTVAATIQRQEEAIKRSLEIDRNYERTMAVVEKLHNQAEDIGDAGNAQ